MDVNEKMAELERKLSVLESAIMDIAVNQANIAVSLTTMNNKKTDILDKKDFKKNKQYVIVTDMGEDGIDYMKESLNEMCNDIVVNARPNVSYVKIPGWDNNEIVLISREFYYQWKKTHRSFYRVSFTELCDILEAAGFSNEEGQV